MLASAAPHYNIVLYCLQASKTLASVKNT